MTRGCHMSFAAVTCQVQLKRITHSCNAAITLRAAAVMYHVIQTSPIGQQCVQTVSAMTDMIYTIVDKVKSIYYAKNQGNR